jgi:hypothetical protein
MNGVVTQKRYSNTPFRRVSYQPSYIAGDSSKGFLSALERLKLKYNKPSLRQTVTSELTGRRMTISSSNKTDLYVSKQSDD